MILDMLKLAYHPLFGSQVNYYPESRYFFDSAYGVYWPFRPRPWMPHYWPLHLLDLWPTEHHMRKIRVRYKEINSIIGKVL